MESELEGRAGESFSLHVSEFPSWFWMECVTSSEIKEIKVRETDDSLMHEPGNWKEQSIPAQNRLELFPQVDQTPNANLTSPPAK